MLEVRQDFPEAERWQPSKAGGEAGRILEVKSDPFLKNDWTKASHLNSGFYSSIKGS